MSYRRRGFKRQFREAGNLEFTINEMVFDASEDDTAALAMVSADLCISAELECVKESGRVPIEHGGQMPELPKFSIVLYSADTPGNQIAQTLVEYLLRAY